MDEEAEVRELSFNVSEVRQSWSEPPTPTPPPVSARRRTHSDADEDEELPYGALRLVGVRGDILRRHAACRCYTP